MERRHHPGPGFREFRPGQPTAGQTCSWKVPAVTTSAFPHNRTKTQGSCPQWSGEALELSQGWLVALLPSRRWIRWEIATSGHIKHWQGIPGFCESLGYYPRPNNVSHVAVGRTMCYTGTKSVKPSICPSFEPQWGLTLIELLRPYYLG